MPMGFLPSSFQSVPLSVTIGRGRTDGRTEARCNAYANGEKEAPRRSVSVEFPSLFYPSVANLMMRRGRTSNP